MLVTRRDCLPFVRTLLFKNCYRTAERTETPYPPSIALNDHEKGTESRFRDSTFFSFFSAGRKRETRQRFNCDVV